MVVRRCCWPDLCIERILRWALGETKIRGVAGDRTAIVIVVLSSIYQFSAHLLLWYFGDSAVIHYITFLQMKVGQ